MRTRRETWMGIGEGNRKGKNVKEMGAEKHGRSGKSLSRSHFRCSRPTPPGEVDFPLLCPLPILLLCSYKLESETRRSPGVQGILTEERAI